MIKFNAFLFVLIATVLITFGLTQWAVQNHIKQRQELIINEHINLNRIADQTNGYSSFNNLRKKILLSGSDDRGLTVLIISSAVGLQFLLASVYLQRKT